MPKVTLSHFEAALLFAFFIVIANFIVDLTYVWLDPRIRLD